MSSVLERLRPSLQPQLKHHYRMLTGRFRLLPDFIIIGAQRCGTTSLHSYLTAHPLVGAPCEKELHFFDYGFERGLAWYRSNFPWRLRRALGQTFITGEASPYYMFHPLAARRIRQAVPDARLIVLLRNPVDRAYSHYHHTVRIGRETLSFEDAIEAEPERLDGEREKILRGQGYYSHAHQSFSYVSRGIYVDQLREWMSVFPREQFLILRSEDFYADPGATVGRVLEFLGLPAWDQIRYKKFNDASYPEMDPAMRKRLADVFRPHNRRLYEYLGMDFRWEEK